MALDAHSFVIFLRFRKYNSELTASNKVHFQKMLITEQIEKLPAFTEPCAVPPDPLFRYQKKSTIAYHILTIQINIILPYMMKPSNWSLPCRLSELKYLCSYYFPHVYKLRQSQSHNYYIRHVACPYKILKFLMYPYFNNSKILYM
jgi:hypothetical protein